MKLTMTFRGAWKLYSVKLAAVIGIVVTALTANPSLLLGLIAFLPTGTMRYVVAAVIGFLAFGLPTTLRIIQQFEDKPDA